MLLYRKKTAKEVGKMFGYKHRGFTTIISEFKSKLAKNDDPFFKSVKKGRKSTQQVNNARSLVIALRKQYHSVDEIKVVLNSKNISISGKSIYGIKNQKVLAGSQEDKSLLNNDCKKTVSKLKRA